MIHRSRKMQILGAFALGLGLFPLVCAIASRLAPG